MYQLDILLLLLAKNNIYTATNILSTIEFHKMDATGSQELEGAKMELLYL